MASIGCSSTACAGVSRPAFHPGKNLGAGSKLETPGRRVDLLPRYGEPGLELQGLVALDKRVVNERIDVIGQILVE